MLSRKKIDALNGDADMIARDLRERGVNAHSHYIFARLVAAEELRAAASAAERQVARFKEDSDEGREFVNTATWVILPLKQRAFAAAKAAGEGR